MSPIEELALMDFDRSNKGASKQRRDQINAEIALMRDLLPVAESSRQRLSQLQIMSLTCVYIRKCNILKKLFRSKSGESQLPDSLDFFQALTGFLLVTTREGKLLYISENVTDFLGHSMVDMKTQGDSLYDIVDKRDHSSVQAQLLQGGHVSEDKGDPHKDVSFFCRMNMSRSLKRQSGFGDVKVMHVRGHFIQVNSSESSYPPTTTGDSTVVFMATCSPLITPDLKENLVQNNTMVFKTVHQLDMTFLEVTKTAEFHLGCTTEDLSNTSWYSILHPEDIHEAKEKHVQLIRSNHEMGCMMTVRMLKADGTSFWVNIVMHIRQASLSQNDEPLIVCINQVVDAQEAYQIKMQGNMFSMYPSRAHELWSSHMPAVTTMSQENNPNGHWTQQNGSNAHSSQGYQGNIPNYIPQTRPPPVYHSLCSGGTPLLATRQVGKPAAGMPNFHPTSLLHSEQLKAMLKRKIQGPQHIGSCKPSKMAKMSWDMDQGNHGTGYAGMEQSMSVLAHYGQVPMSSPADSQGPTMEVLQPSNYRIGVLTARKAHNQVMACSGRVSLMSKTRLEQVVPDVNVPESYLTPDPSPVSSPQPSVVTVKTEVMDPEEMPAQGKSSVNILQALEKLAALPQKMKREDVTTSAVQPRQMPQVQASANPRRKELPIFDAFDIDDFFDALIPPTAYTKASLKMGKEKQIKQEIKTEVPEEQPVIDNIPNLAALKEERRTPDNYSCYQSQAVISNNPQASPQPQFPPQAHTPFPQGGIPSSPEAPMLPLPCQDMYTMSESLRTASQANIKDLVVTSTMVSSPNSMPAFSPNSVVAASPRSVTSQESIDDLLSYFSDDGVEIPSLHMDSSSSIVTTSTNEDYLDDQPKTSFSDSFYTGMHCSIPLQIGIQRLPEELSPQSSTSSVAEDDDFMDDHSTFTLDMALDVLDAQDEKVERSPCSIKDRDVLGMPDQMKLDSILKSLVPSEGSVSLIKYGQ